MILDRTALFSGRSPGETLFAVFLILCLLFSQISISIEQIFLGLGLACWAVLLATGKKRLSFPPFFWPLLGYAALSLVSSALSVNPETSFKDSRELLLFLLVPMVYAAFSRVEDIKLASFALLLSGLINAAYAIGYSFLGAFPGERIKGFMGHYMTQAGLLVLFGAVALGVAFFGRGKKKIVWAAAFVLSAWALVLTLTRSGWIGLAAALSVILVLWKPRTLVLVPILAAVLFLVSPRTVRYRALSIFSLRDPSNQARLAYAKAGIMIIKDFPLFGTGPDTVDMVFQEPKYGLDAIAKMNVHLHSNLVQIAAERGMIAALAWLGFIATAFVTMLRHMRKKEPEVYALAAGALAALSAFFIAGFFEYNFGDSEIMTLLLFILTLPSALARIGPARPILSAHRPGED
jgi:O-antigen ligase